MSVTEEQVKEAIPKLVQGAFEGKHSTLSPMIFEAYEKAQKDIRQESMLSSSTLTDPEVNEAAKNRVIENTPRIIKKSLLSGEMTPEEKREAIDSGLSLFGMGEKTLMGSIIGIFTSAGGFLGRIKDTIMEWAFGDSDKSLSEIWKETGEMQYLKKFARNNNIDYERLVEDIKNPPNVLITPPTRGATSSPTTGTGVSGPGTAAAAGLSEAQEAVLNEQPIQFGSANTGSLGTMSSPPYNSPIKLDPSLMQK